MIFKLYVHTHVIIIPG